MAATAGAVILAAATLAAAVSNDGRGRSAGGAAVAAAGGGSQQRGPRPGPAPGTALPGTVLPGTAPPSAAPPRAAPANLPASGFRYLGVYEGSSTSAGQYAQVEQFAQATGRQPNLVLLYAGWGEPFAASYAQAALSHGATLVIDLDPTSTSSAAIAAGGQDSFLRSYADAVRAFGDPVIISFGHEMNGTWYPWGWTNTQPAVFVQAWRHVVDVFRQEGADNAEWLWTVNAVSPGEGPIADYWPGASYVTWAGMDAYYYFADDTFASVFDPTITAIRQVTSKPILISETAIGQVSGQAADIPLLFAGVKASGLLGFIWFDLAQDSGIYHQDWRVEDNPGAAAAFSSAAATYLQAPSPAAAGAGPP